MSRSDNIATREVLFDRQAYSIDAVQRAAYRLSDRLSVDLAVEETVIRCVVHVGDAASVEDVLAQLRNEALDEVLRERIRNETEEVRNVILALAFSQTGLVE